MTQCVKKRNKFALFFTGLLLFSCICTILFTSTCCSPLQELLGDSNPMVVANAVAALSEINDSSPTGCVILS